MKIFELHWNKPKHNQKKEKEKEGKNVSGKLKCCKTSSNIRKRSITRLRANWCIQIYLRHSIYGWLQVFETNLNIWWCEFLIFSRHCLPICAKYDLTHIICKIISQKHKKKSLYAYVKFDLQESMSSWMKQIFSNKIIKK